MGLFKDLGCLIGEIAEATGHAADELIDIAASTAVDEISRPYRRVRKTTTIIEDDYIYPRRKVTIVEEEPDLGSIFFGGYGRHRRW